MKVDLSKSFDEMTNSKKKNKKKLSLNENIGKEKKKLFSPCFKAYSPRKRNSQKN